MKEAGKTIIRLFSGYLIGIPIVFLIMESLELMKVYDSFRLTWIFLALFFIWFYVAGLINKKTKPILLLFLYPILSLTYFWSQFYFPMIAYVVIFATIGLILTRKEISKKIKYALSVLTTVMFGYFLFSQPLIIKKEGFGLDLELNLVNVTVVWNFSKKTLSTVPTENFLNQNGEKVNLSQFKGKTIFVTFWATWCGPCMAEKPELEILKKGMTNTNEVIFIDISFDSDKEIWNNYLSEYKPKGIQLRSQNSSKTFANFQISGIPHYIIVNAEGFYKKCAGPQVDWAKILSNSSSVDKYVKSPRKIINMPVDKTKMPSP